MDSRAAVRSVAALNGDPVTESGGLWILVGADPEIHLADALALHLLEGAEHPTGDHGADAVVHRFGHPVDHLAALGLDRDLSRTSTPRPS